MQNKYRRRNFTWNLSIEHSEAQSNHGVIKPVIPYLGMHLRIYNDTEANDWTRSKGDHDLDDCLLNE